jgi:RHS repeat-associated protein
MDMIGHQAVTHHRYSVEFNVFPQQGQIGRTIRIAIQDEAPVVSTLGQVVWHIHGNYPSESSHSKETISANRVYLAASRKDELQLILDWRFALLALLTARVRRRGIINKRGSRLCRKCQSRLSTKPHETLFASPTYNAAGQLTAASLAVNPLTQQSMIGLSRTYDLRLRPLSESDAGQVGTPGIQATATVNVTGTEQSIGGSGTPAQATGTISFSHSGGALVKEGAGALHPIPLLVGSSITLPDGYHAAFTPSTNSALTTANSLAAVLNGAFSPVTAVVASGGTASAASVTLTTKATGVAQNGAITLRLVGTQVTAAPASLSGGSGTAYDAGTVTVTVNNTSLTANYGQLSTPQTVAQGLASAITGANLGVTASAGSNGALTVTANQAGTADNGMAVTLASSSSEPGLFPSPSFSGTSGSLGGGADGTFSPGMIYNYSIPSPGTPTTGYAGNGNLLSFTDLINGQWTATYDTLNRVLTATVAGTPSTTLTWSYDAFGNRQPQGPNGGTLNYPPGNNRISGSGYTYDASGNITEDPSNQYAYDGEGRLCTVYNKTLFTYTGYAYDGLGNRVAKGTATNGLNCDNTFTATSSFVVGPNGEQLDEMNATGAVYSNVFANGKLLATYQFPTSKWTFALNDWLGTKRFVANADGTKAETCTGLPFGDGPPCTGTGSDPSPQHFTGKERDTESGLDYFGARYYGSNMGRMMSPDPGNIGANPANPQSWNMYSYSLNNPLTMTDPSGLYVCADSSKCDSANDKAFATALSAARDAANRLTGDDKTAALRGLDAYGEATKDNGVKVGFDSSIGGGLTKTSGVANGNKSDLNPNGQNISVTLNPNFANDAYGGADLVSHEGSHVADGSAWVASGFSSGFDPTYHQGDIDANHVQFNIMNSMNNAQTPSGSSWAGAGLYGGSVKWDQGATFKGITPDLANAIRKSYAAQGIDDSKPSLQKGSVLPK